MLRSRSRTWFVAFTTLCLSPVCTSGCGSSDGSSPGHAPADRDASADATYDAADAAVPDGPNDGRAGDATDGSGPCEPNPCDEPHKTQCEEVGGAAVCSCDPGFVEQEGSCVAQVACQPDSCHGHGTCEVVDNAVVCTCEPGWGGATCEQCDEADGWHDDGEGGCTQDPCTPDPCTDPDTVCVVEAGQAVCACRPGTHEEGGACVPDGTCQPNSCNGHGTCSDAGGTVVCICDPGWEGAACDQCDVMGGWHPDGQGGCSQDPCVPNPCTEVHQKVCEEQGGTAVCSCDPGYHDEGGVCVQDEACSASSCSGHGTCQDGTGVVMCDCDPGYDGAACDVCADGFHDDGAGGCTDDVCVPNPCTSPQQTVCVPSGGGYACQCDPGAHPDGQGGCTTDPCEPDPCASQNLACEDQNGSAHCYEPDCNDGNPCTKDTLVGGACEHEQEPDGSGCATSACLVGESCTAGVCSGGAPADCDDGNPCTVDGCDPASGCESVVDASLVPDDGFACTVDSCDASGVSHHVADDGLCDDGLYCTGTETCSPGSPNAGSDGCVTTGVPQPPASGSDCSTWGACSESEPHFTQVEAAPGTPCDDRIACTTNDRCEAGGVCRGTVIAGCLTSPCTTTSSYGGAIDVPVSTLEVGMTLDGQPLPSGGNPSSSTANVYLRAQDTGVLHEIYHRWYTSTGGPWPDPAEHAHSVLPGVYDLVYRRGYSSSSSVVDENPDGDKLPNGYRVLDTGLVVGAGHNAIVADVPSATIDVGVTVGGAPLPSGGNPSSSTAFFYLRSSDTGTLHQVRRLWYTSTGGPWPDPAEDAYSLVPGNYDVLYRRGHSATDGVVSENPDGDALPNGYRVVAQDYVVSAGHSALTVDVPVARVDAVDVTVGGAPLPSGGNPSSSTAQIYLRSKDTGALHQVRRFWYTSTGGPWPSPATHAYSVLPGEYEVVYRRGYSSSSGVVAENPQGDKLPNGYRVIEPGITLQPGDNSLSFDVPVATIQAVNVTLDGGPLPDGGSSSSASLGVYLRARDTGVLHQIRTIWYTSTGGPWPDPAEHAQSVPAGAYDVVVRRGWSSSTNVVSENDSGDRLPTGYRVLQENLVLGSGAHAIDVDIPVATLGSVTVLLNQGSLPAGGNPSSAAAHFYLRARDTGALQEIRTIWYTSTGGPWPDDGAHAHSILPGTYDLVYRRGWSSSDELVSENPTGDKLPNGYRVLSEGVVIGAGSNDLVIDLRDVLMTADVTLSGSPLPVGGNPSSASMRVFLRSRDTSSLHGLRTIWYTSTGGPWPDDGAHAWSLAPGQYDVLYRRGSSTTTGVVSENPTGDKLPNGFRVLQRCVVVP